ncbi:MAG TPA: prepilin-type N-terminal cleavage/methylation domain-containing protein [Chthoniobacteraceae bacterium]|nr:prepilin-type N-terminal cleavage/methylation domain-containing protein [Chthoniobacteraceae bacterium]
MNRFPQRLRRDGFTLLELVITLVIVGVLTSLLFPLLKGARESGDAGRCTSNLKQIGVAVGSYMNDHQGTFPVSRLQYTMDKNGSKKTVSFLPDLLKRLDYLPVEEINAVWWCPGDRLRPEKMRKYSYGLNQQLGGGKANPLTWDGQPNPEYDARYARLSGVVAPLSRIIYAVDYVDRRDEGKWSSVVTGGCWPLKAKSSPEADLMINQIDMTRHGKRANALFLDGSVRALGYEEIAGTASYHISPE